jgi:hypothetical protein
MQNVASARAAILSVGSFMVLLPVIVVAARYRRAGD